MYSCSAVSNELISAIVVTAVIISFGGWYVWRKFIESKPRTITKRELAWEEYARRFEGWMV